MDLMRLSKQMLFIIVDFCVGITLIVLALWFFYLNCEQFFCELDENEMLKRDCLAERLVRHVAKRVSQKIASKLEHLTNIIIYFIASAMIGRFVRRYVQRPDQQQQH
jgi:hypothetical protein